MMEKPNHIIQFHYLENNFSFKNRTRCKAYIETLFKKEKKRLGELNYIFCSDDYLLDINKAYLQHNYYTDIITFGLSNPGEPIVGEIYISVDRVKDNAANLDESFTRELHRVIFHGALHLCGYGDKTQKEELAMRALEDKYLRGYLG